jgi:hypothetical protein
MATSIIHILSLIIWLVKSQAALAVPAWTHRTNRLNQLQKGAEETPYVVAQRISVKKLMQPTPPTNQRTLTNPQMLMLEIFQWRWTIDLNATLHDQPFLEHKTWMQLALLIIRVPQILLLGALQFP